MGKDIAKLVLALGALCSPLEASVNSSEPRIETSNLTKVSDYIKNSFLPRYGFVALATLGSFLYLISDKYNKREDYSR